MTKIKGRLWRTDAEGFLRNDASAEHIRPPFAVAVNAAVGACTEQIANDIHSIYVTGSIARGLAAEGQSRLEVFAVLAPQVDPELVLRDWIGPAQQRLAAEHGAIAEAQIDLWAYNHVFTDPGSFSIGAFIVKTNSVCVWGSDLSPELPDYKIHPAIANEDLAQIRDDIMEAAAALKKQPDEASLRRWGHEIMARILWSGFGLVMVEEGVYTRDFDLCYEYFARHYPGHAGDMRRALQYVENPSGSAEELLAYLGDMGDWMIVHADTWMQQYNPGGELPMKVESEEESE